MQPNLARKIRTLALICLCTSLSGVIYQLIDEDRINYSSVMFGLPLGIVFGFLELFLFPKASKRLRRWSFSKMILVKTLLYTSVIYFVAIFITTTVGLLEGRRLSELPPYLGSLGLLILVVYTLVIYSLLVFFLQINLLLGEGVLWKFIRGKYHHPHEEERIFMFLDMRSSTTIAEQLGHVRFYRLLNELFHEISQPVLQTKAEIYQYIGDEVVLTWEMENGLENSNCLKIFFLFKERLLRNEENYFKNFGVKPEFKAGLHFGKVISAQIGDLKKEIVYNGDVLNTTARIQNECNRYQRDCLVSGTLMDRLKKLNGYQWERVDAVVLRGKETEDVKRAEPFVHFAKFDHSGRTGDGREDCKSLSGILYEQRFFSTATKTARRRVSAAPYCGQREFLSKFKQRQARSCTHSWFGTAMLSPRWMILNARFR